MQIELIFTMQMQFLYDLIQIANQPEKNFIG